MLYKELDLKNMISKEKKIQIIKLNMFIMLLMEYRYFKI